MGFTKLAIELRGTPTQVGAYILLVTRVCPRQRCFGLCLDGFGWAGVCSLASRIDAGTSGQDRQESWKASEAFTWHGIGVR